MPKFYITTPIYYVNSKPHLGNAYTTIIADILARYHRMKGDDVYFLTGTDEHGAKVAKTAREVGIDPQKFCDERAALFQFAFDTLNISNNDFIRTTEERHETRVKVILNKLKTLKTPLGNDVFFEGEYSGLYCTGCEKYITEEELVDGKCPDHQRAPEFLTEKNWFFRLSDYNSILQEKILSNELTVAPDVRRQEVLGLLKQGLQDIAISRNNVEWGIALPWDTNQTVYVWIEALMNYITALGYGSDDASLCEKYWEAAHHLMAKDILKFHALIWPALLITLGLPVPRLVFAHGFFTVDGTKMSKTIGNTLDPVELAQDVGVDPLRFYLATELTFGHDGDVSTTRLQEVYSAHLANGLGNVVARVLGMYEKYQDKLNWEVEFPVQVWNEPAQEAWKNYTQFFDELKIDQAISEVLRLISVCDKCVEENKPWELAKNNENEKLSQVILGLIENLRHIAWMISPVMPETSEKILNMLGVADTDRGKTLEQLQTWHVVRYNITRGEILFPRREASE